MPTIFLSYARDDMAVANQLSQWLSNHGISVWRDQEKIYGGQRWPKILGEAISVQDFCLLLWSKNAAHSTYVELEWCTAIALKKTLLPCLLDDTALPASLSAINSIHANDLPTAIPHILSAVSTPVRVTDPTHSAAVIKQLGAISAKDPQDVVQAAHTLFEQRQWTVQGNVYQAAGHIFITTKDAPVAPPKTMVEKWQTWLALIASVLTAITLAVQLPKLWSENTNTVSSLEGEQKLQAAILAEVRKAMHESRGKNEPTISGLSSYDESYLVATIVAIREIAAQIHVKIAPSIPITGYDIAEDNIVTGNEISFGSTLRLGWNTSVKNYQVGEDFIRLDVFPSQLDESNFIPDQVQLLTQVFTIIIKNYMVQKISEDFSIKQFDNVLRRAGFAIETPKVFPDGTLEVKCRYSHSKISEGRLLIGMGVGVPSNFSKVTKTRQETQ